MLLPFLLENNSYTLVVKEKLPKSSIKKSYNKLSFPVDGVCFGEINGIYYLIDTLHNNTIELKNNYDELRPFKNGLAPVHTETGWNFINRRGEEMCKSNYYYYVILSNNFILIESIAEYGGHSDDYSSIGVTKWYTGVIDNTGFEIITPKFECLIDLIKDTYFLVTTKNEYLLYKRSGELLISTSEFGFISKFEYDRAIAIENKTSKVFLIDINFCKIKLLGIDKEDILEFNIDGFKSGLMPINIEGNWGIINSAGEMVSKFIYASAENFIDGISIVSKYISNNLKYSFIDNQGNEIIDFIYDKIFSFSDGFASFQDRNKYGMIDKKGSIIIKAEFSSVDIATNGFVVVSIGEDRKLFGIYDTLGNKISSIKYDGISILSNGFSLVRMNEKYGLINRKGDLIIEIIYDVIFEEPDNYFNVTLNEKSFIIDQFGTEYTEEFMRHPSLAYVEILRAESERLKKL